MVRKGTLYFFTGLSGAGKTTIGGLFYRRLKERRNDLVLLDGDQVRAVFGNTNRGHSTEARRRIALENLFPLCRLLTEQGVDVVCCSIAMYDDVRAWNRAHFDPYREIYIKASRETLLRRDQKGLYTSGATCPGTSPKSRIW